MLDFYGILAWNKYERVYQVMNHGWQEKQYLDSIIYNDKTWTMDFQGTLIQREEGEKLLLRKRKSYHNEKEYLIALYSLVAEKIRNYISEDSFLLLDNGQEVYIHNSTPLYFAREKEGEICISSNTNAFKTNQISILEKNSSLLFYNNNLKMIKSVL